MEVDNKKIFQYLLISLLSTFFALLLSFLYLNSKPKDVKTLPPVVVKTEIIPSEVPIKLPSTILTTPDVNIPLIAYIDKENVFIYDKNLATSKQITKNGSIKNIRWSKDGQWLYWYAEYTNVDKSKTATFARGRFPDFHLEILFDLNRSGDINNYTDIVWGFFPLAKSNKMLVTTSDGLYLMSNFQNRKATIVKQLIKAPQTFPGDDRVHHSYTVADTNKHENTAYIYHSDGWEMMIDIGYLNFLELNPRYSVFVNPKQKNYTGSMLLSPDEKSLLVYGGSNEMSGSDTEEIIFDTRSGNSKTYIKSILSDDIGSGIWLTNNKILFSDGYDYLYTQGNLPKRIGYSIVDITKQIEEKFISTVKVMPDPNSDVFNKSLALFRINSNRFLLNNYSDGVLSEVYLDQGGNIVRQDNFDISLGISSQYIMRPQLERDLQ